MSQADVVYEALEAMGIPFERREHPAIFTSEDAAQHWRDLDGTGCKNLFLRNKKGDRHYLVILDASRQADLRQLVKVVGDDRLSFASPERLMRLLGLTPGSVSPFGLWNDTAHTVRVLVDETLRQSARLIFHPNINTASVSIAYADFERFLASRGNSVAFVKIG